MNTSLELGYEELERCGGDLRTALQQTSLQAEVAVAWLDHAIKIEPEKAGELVQLVACVLGETNERN